MSPDRLEGQDIEIIGRQSIATLQRDPRGRIRWALFKDKPTEVLSAAIEDEALRLQSEGVLITDRGLKNAKQSGFGFGISKFYPGGITQLQRRIGSDVINTPKNAWTPDALEEEAKRLLTQGIPLSSRGLRLAGFSGFEPVVNRNYPGQMRQLKAKLGVEPREKPKGFWKDPKNIEQEVVDYIAKGGKLRPSDLKRARKTSLWNAIMHYPGGLSAIREKFQLESYYHPAGYWTPEVIEKEAAAFIQSSGGLSSSLLEQRGMSGFYAAIRLHYPGGMKKLTEKFGVYLRKSKNNPWTSEEIEQEAKKFAEAYGTISRDSLYEHGRKDLASAITSNYPGRLHGLRAVLGIAEIRKPVNFWTPEQIEAAALEVYQATGALSYRIFRELRRNDLSVAIPKKYPGGLMALRKKLGIPTRLRENLISSNEANQQLRRLLEEEI